MDVEWLDLLQFTTETEGIDYRVRVRVTDIGATLQLEFRNADGEFHVKQFAGEPVRLWLPDGLQGEKSIEDVRRWTAWVRRWAEEREILAAEDARRKALADQKRERDAANRAYAWGEIAQELQAIRPETFRVKYEEARPKPEDGEDE